VDQEEIHIIKTEIIQRVLESLLDVVRVVLVVPQLRREEDFLAGDAALLDGVADGLFGAVAVILLAIVLVGWSALGSAWGDIHSRRIDVSVSSLESIGNGLFLRVDVLPGAEADGGDGGAGVELECGHFRVFVYSVLLQLSLMVQVVIDIVWAEVFYS
jgi:hypothetical protein